MTPKRPNFIIIGSAKSGTTSLAGILDRHPDCCFSRPKEVSFFQDMISPVSRLYCQEFFSREVYSPQDMIWSHSKIWEPNPNFLKGWDWYSQAWSHYNGEPMVGEATPDYSDRTNSPQTASRIHAFNREMKIIYMVREPLARMVSHWQMFHRLAQNGLAVNLNEANWAKKGFEFYMTARLHCEAFWDTTLYHYQLEPYLKLYPREQVLVSFLEDWKSDQNQEISRILKFLTLDPSKLGDQDTKALNVAAELAKHTALQRFIVKSRMRPLLRAVVPQSLWSRLAAKYAQTSYRSVKPELTLATFKKFLDHVREDNQLFLKEWGKPCDYWIPAKVPLLES
jgi:Sulfotransferase domain